MLIKSCEQHSKSKDKPTKRKLKPRQNFDVRRGFLIHSAKFAAATKDSSIIFVSQIQPFSDLAFRIVGFRVSGTGDGVGFAGITRFDAHIFGIAA